MFPGHLELLCGYTLILALFWFAGYRVARLLPQGKTVCMSIQQITKPGLTLLTLVMGYDVLAIALDPFLSPGGRAFYDAVVALSALGSGVWLIIALGQIVRRHWARRAGHVTVRRQDERSLENRPASRRHGAGSGQGSEPEGGSGYPAAVEVMVKGRH